MIFKPDPHILYHRPVPQTLRNKETAINSGMGRTWTLLKNTIAFSEFIENVRSTWDRTYFLMLVRSADPADRRCDRQTDGRTDRWTDVIKVLRAF